MDGDSRSMQKGGRDYYGAAKAFEELLRTRDRLRDPGGCPWDRKQTLETAKTYLLEEAFEAAEAADSNDLDMLAEELGDLLFQALFTARIGQDMGGASDRDILKRVAAKLVRRHPHVFGDEKVESVKDVLETWGRVKAGEQGPGHQGVLSGVPAALPALTAAQRLQEKAGQVGFDWPEGEGSRGPLSKLKEELAELEEAVGSGDEKRIKQELGDLLFTAVNLARRLNLDAEGSLRSANSRFKSRFEYMEKELEQKGVGLSDASIQAMDALWEEAKALEDSDAGNEKTP